MDKKEKEIQELQEKTKEKNFWNNACEAGLILKRIEKNRKEIYDWSELKKQITDLIVFLKTEEEYQKEDLCFLIENYQAVKKKIEEYEAKSYFDGEYDDCDIILIISAGAGGTDAQDWSEMISRMYLRYFERNKNRVRIVEENRGLEAGIKTITMEVKGEMIYGNLKSEKGVHRLVRLSPFNADNLRQTSFALVEVIPIIKSEINIIDNKDLKFEAFRSSGAGGQHVNTTDSAVRVKHLPTGIMATCQSERSQVQNREQALKILKTKVFHYLENKKKEKDKEIKGEYQSAEWGNQIRSYVLHPYKMVKDHRTGYKENNPERVLGGEIENFIIEYLKYYTNKKIRKNLKIET